MNTWDPKRPTEDNKRLAKVIAEVFGGPSRVIKHNHDDIAMSIPILSSLNVPSIGLTSYATIGLSDCTMNQNDEDYPARVELLGACTSEQKLFSNVIAGAAFHIMLSHWLCYPGVV